MSIFEQKKKNEKKKREKRIIKISHNDRQRTFWEEKTINFDELLHLMEHKIYKLEHFNNEKIKNTNKIAKKKQNLLVYNKKPEFQTNKYA